MQRFFVEPYQIEEEAHRIHINGTDVNHIKNVLRMKCGEDVWISDGGDKEYHCQIKELFGMIGLQLIETVICLNGNTGHYTVYQTLHAHSGKSV